MAKEILHNFSELIIEEPMDKVVKQIIKQIKGLISSGQLKPGDKLPPERKLSERFGVGRTYIREALQKLEFYGILKTLPQNGTVVAGLGIAALEGLISDVLELEGNDFHALVETRIVLEVNSARYAAMRRTKDDVVSMANSLAEYEKNVNQGLDTVENDLLFHLKIAEASKNPVLKSLMLIILPDILTDFKENNICGGDQPIRALKEHYQILEHIEKKDADMAAESMKNHLNDVLIFSLNKKKSNKGGVNGI